MRVKVNWEGDAAFIPDLKTGNFPLRPLHPRKLNRLPILSPLQEAKSAEKA